MFTSQGKLIENSRLHQKFQKKYRKNTGMVSKHKNVFLKGGVITKSAKNANFIIATLLKNTFLCFETKPVLFLYFFGNFY